jgi:hypothetical protein
MTGRGSLVRQEIDGRMATMAYLSGIYEGELVAPEFAKSAMVVFDDGERRHYALTPPYSVRKRSREKTLAVGR